MWTLALQNITKPVLDEEELLVLRSDFYQLLKLMNKQHKIYFFPLENNSLLSSN